MLLGPFWRRELFAAARRGDTYRGRVVMAVAVTATIAICAGAWDYWGWDRTTIGGAKAFGLTTFGLIVGLIVALVLGAVPAILAPAIAVERDRKTLDALLATPLSSMEIVLGTLAAGLTRLFFYLFSFAPIFVLVTYLGGIDVRWALLVAGALGSTALALGALSVAVSAGARTARRAVGLTLLLMGAWFFVPGFLVGALARGWPAAARWVMPAVLWVLDSSPFVVVTHVAGLVRRASLPGAILRMIALQVPVAFLLIVGASGRLRAASRAIYDGDGRASLLRSLRTSRRKRRPCGDDPILWNEIHSTRGVSNGELLITSIIRVFCVVALAVATSWFALPAFSELLERGYTASPEAFRMPDVHPVARLLAYKLTTYGSGPATGQARLEFNIVLRQVSALFSFILVLAIAGAGAEGITAERERDTWLGVLSTPLSGAEIVRAKMLGAIWRSRECAAWMVGIWVTGLLTGAVHPAGFIAAAVELAVSSWLFAAIGTYASLWSPSRDKAMGRAVLPALALAASGLVLMALPEKTGSVLIGAGSPPFLTWSSLMSYEDVVSALHSGAFPQFVASDIKTGDGAWMVLAMWILGTTAQWIAAFLFTRAACRGFDAAVGRPCRKGQSHGIGA